MTFICHYRSVINKRTSVWYINNPFCYVPENSFQKFYFLLSLTVICQGPRWKMLLLCKILCSHIYSFFTSDAQITILFHYFTTVHKVIEAKCTITQAAESLVFVSYDVLMLATI
jgi:hypothetical protein